MFGLLFQVEMMCSLKRSQSRMDPEYVAQEMWKDASRLIRDPKIDVFSVRVGGSGIGLIDCCWTGVEGVHERQR